MEVTYLITSGGNLWVVSFNTYADEYEKHLPIFEQSIRTFVDQSGDL